jgi:hypothetical protein
MLRKPCLTLCIASLSFLVWPFVAIERLVGDHERGITWEVFLKHEATLQVRFTNPAQQGLEIVPFDHLSGEEQGRFMQFCAVRCGVTGPKQCYAKIAARNI